jgi:hypothetical protein
MSTKARVGAVHALAASIDPTQAAFNRVWKEADVAHLMDGSLYLDRSRGTAGPEEIAARIDRLIRHSAATGAQGILFTGSFFGDAVRQARASVAVPVLTSFDGIIERALGLHQPLVVISTAPDSATLLAGELERESGARGLDTAISTAVVEGALAALERQDFATHDRLVLDAIAGLGTQRAIVIAQFSMERVIEQAASIAGATVIGTATEGVALLRRTVTGA